MHGPVFGAVARSLGAPKRTPTAAVEDACAFAWAQAWRHRDRLAGIHPVALRSWLIITAKRYAWEQQEKPQPTAGRDAAEIAGDIAGGGRDLAADIDTKMQVAELLDKVTPDQRDVIVLQAIGMGYREIAKALGRSETSVNHALTRGRAKMRGEKRER